MERLNVQAIAHFFKNSIADGSGFSRRILKSIENQGPFTFQVDPVAGELPPTQREVNNMMGLLIHRVGTGDAYFDK